MYFILHCIIQYTVLLKIQLKWFILALYYTANFMENKIWKRRRYRHSPCAHAVRIKSSPMFGTWINLPSWMCSLCIFAHKKSSFVTKHDRFLLQSSEERNQAQFRRICIFAPRSTIFTVLAAVSCQNLVEIKANERISIWKCSRRAHSRRQNIHI